MFYNLNIPSIFFKKISFHPKDLIICYWIYLLAYVSLTFCCEWDLFPLFSFKQSFSVNFSFDGILYLAHTP